MPIKCTKHGGDDDKQSLFIFVIEAYGELEPQDIDHLNSNLLQLISDDLRFKVLFDIRKLNDTPVHLVQKIHNCFSSYDDDQTKKTIIATSIVVSQKELEQFINLCFMFKSPIIPTKVTNCMFTACNFLNNHVILA